MEFRKRLVRDFSVVFNGSAEGEDVRNTTEDFAKRWGWFGVMYRLTEGKIINLDRISKLSLLECLTWLTYETDLESQNKVQLHDRK